MSKNRMINTKIWSDGWIIELTPLERYFFIYLLTNEHTNICGIYELNLKIMIRETDIPKKDIQDILQKIKDKISYIDGWIYIKNFLKHQRSSGNVKLGIEKGLQDVPSHIMAKTGLTDDTPPSDPRHSPIPEPKPEPKLKDYILPEKENKEIKLSAKLVKIFLEEFNLRRPDGSYEHDSIRPARSVAVYLREEYEEHKKKKTNGIDKYNEREYSEKRFRDILKKMDDWHKEKTVNVKYIKNNWNKIIKTLK